MEQQYESGSKAAPMLGAAGGGCAVLIGLILLIAFFLPWTAGYDGDESAFDAVKEDIGADSALGEALTKLILSSTALAGCGSVILGLGLAAVSLIARRDAAFKSWMAGSIGSMVVLGSFWPCFLWTIALLDGDTDSIKIGMWLSLGSAALLVVASLIGLLSAFMAQREQS